MYLHLLLHYSHRSLDETQNSYTATCTSAKISQMSHIFLRVNRCLFDLSVHALRKQRRNMFIFRIVYLHDIYFHSPHQAVGKIGGIGVTEQLCV